MTEDGLVLEGLRYQWYMGYDREQEFEKNPQWAADMGHEELEVDTEADNEATKPVTKIFDRFDPEHMWIKSDKTYDLTNTL